MILGSSLSGCLTLCTLAALRNREHPQTGRSFPVAVRLLQAALPLALADVLKSGISTVENLMVPKRLAKNPMIADPLACFGTVSGMVFPILMFPACILYGLAFSGLMYLLADTLCLRFYGSAAAGRYLRLYAPLIPMLCCDAITDTMTKGLEQQKACVRYNILTSAWM